MSAYGRTWWGKKWLRVLEPLGLTYPDNRIVRGRALAGGDAVDGLLVEPGSITAWVDRPRRAYGVEFTVPEWTDERWAAAYAALAGRPRRLADLVDDRLPEDAEAALAGHGTGLFPGGGELRTSCPCRAGGPCAHVIAVQHAFAARFDDDPFLLPLLRGRDRAALLAGVTGAYARTAPPPAGAPAGLPVAALPVDGYDAVPGARESLLTW